MTPRRFLPILLAAAAACAVGGVLPVAGPGDVQRGVERYPDVTLGELASGREIFASHCGACHAPPAPGSKPADAWPAEIHEMRVRAKLDDGQARLVERYLVTMAQSARN
jgi:mono/diheme cytochrome c family protein